MPEVRAWVESSGLTLDELASIQPGYEQPVVEDWIRWDVAKVPSPDGAYRDAATTGAWRHRRMEGTWTRTDDGGGRTQRAATRQRHVDQLLSRCSSSVYAGPFDGRCRALAS
jgi:hypothetical protein